MLRFVTLLFPVTAVLLMTTGCDPLLENRTISTMHLSMDGVKLISATISQGDAPHTFDQTSYELDEDQRLLIRLETLLAEVDKVSVEAGKKVWVEVAAPSIDEAQALAGALELCPVTRSWMMLATWVYAHPFGAGTWEMVGGDLDESGCMTGTVKQNTKVVQFDATQWFIDYPRGKRENYGLILVAKESVTVLGERSGSHSPRLVFENYIQTSSSSSSSH